MRKPMKWIVLCLVVLAGFFYVQRSTIWLGNPDCGVITYSYGEIYIREELYGKDLDDVVKILNGKREYTDNPACGFSDDISITIGGNTLALACDSCGVVKNCTTGKYIYISDAERDVLEAMFTSRGGKFPCV
jgi:hypothetical protein